jgi:hypothetical protein
MYCNDDLKKTFEILAYKLTKNEYDIVTNIMYSLYMGVEFGYMDSDVSGLLVDAKYIYEEVSKKKFENFKEKIKRVK